MNLDIIEIRVGNYFALKNEVKQINDVDLEAILVLQKSLVPLKITPQRLTRLNFALTGETHSKTFQKYSNNIYFDFHRTKTDRLLLVVNSTIRLPHIAFIHQLQNLYYDLTGDVLLRPAQVAENYHNAAKPQANGK